MIIDTHAHIYLGEFNRDREEMLVRATDAGVGAIYMPNIDHTSIDAMLETELKNGRRCFPMMGLHPCSVKKDFERELYLVEEWLGKRKFAAVGEMGTDLYWDKTFWEQQKEAFVIQVGLAKKHDLPLVIHCRETIDETIELIRPHVAANLRGIFHCFTGSIEQAMQIVEMGFKLGIGGVATFKNGGLDKVLPHVSLESIVLETDSPYLAPVPHRGKRNEPSYLPLIVARLADLFRMPATDVVARTTQNAAGIFHTPKGVMRKLSGIE